MQDSLRWLCSESLVSSPSHSISRSIDRRFIEGVVNLYGTDSSKFDTELAGVSAFWCNEQKAPHKYVTATTLSDRSCLRTFLEFVATVFGQVT